MSNDVTLTRRVRGRLGIYPIDIARDFGVDAFFTDRSGGVSPSPYDELNLASHVGDDDANVAENRARVCDAMGVDITELVTVRQVHGNLVVDAATSPMPRDADGLVTSSNSLALAILVADCVPILLVDAASDHFAVVHAGWRGLSAGVLANAVSCFPAPQSLRAFIGPSISSARYQVGPEVAAHFASVPGALERDVDDRSRLDLRRVSSVQLHDLGLKSEHVFASTQVTDGGAAFFSDRAQRPCGRFALVAKRAS